MNEYLGMFSEWMDRFYVTFQICIGKYQSRGEDDGEAMAMLLREHLAEKFILRYNICGIKSSEVSFFYFSGLTDCVCLSVGSKEARLPLLMSIKEFAERIGMEKMMVVGDNIVIVFSQ